jgi:hypothetical protein
MKNKIEAVRLKASNVIIKVIKKSPKDWCEVELLPLLAKTRDEPNYLIRQRVIAIIEETYDQVSNNWLSTCRKIIN